MLKLSLTNINYLNNYLYIFYRDQYNHLKYYKKFYKNYYFTLNSQGKFRVYGQKDKADKVYYKKKYYNNQTNFESDVLPEKHYLIDEIEITKTKLRYLFMDIEIIAPEFPKPTEAKYPVAVIVIYDSYSHKTIKFNLKGFDNEKHMIEVFADVVKSIKPDLIVGWNILSFDWLYLINRFPELPKMISPVGLQSIDRMPVGISLLDYMLIDKKFTQNRKKSYSLENRANEEVNFELNEKIDFTKYSDDVETKCLQDINRLITMEKKLKYIDLCDDIRILSKCLWSDIYYNSRIIDQLMLQEARKLNIILPNQVYKGSETFEAAYRVAKKKGLFKNVTMYDLSGAYLYTVYDLCLDKDNFVDNPTHDSIKVFITKRDTNEIIKYFYLKQNPNTLLPRLAKKLIDNKIKFKELLNNTNPEDAQYNAIESIYNAIKSIYLSVWGVLGHHSCRTYDTNITSIITSTIRDLLRYVENEVKKMGYEVIYIDTDSITINSEDNISDLLNNLIQKWSKERFNKPSSIYFEYKGKFKSIIILDECRYKGYIETNSGLKEEIKGLEIKRKDSSIFMSKFQNDVLNKILLEDYNENQTTRFIFSKINDIYKENITNIAFPAKLSKDIEEYKTIVTNYKGTTYTRKPPIFIQAIENAKKYYPDFNPKNSEFFYWLYIEGGIPVAFDNEHPLPSNIKIDWNKMIERNILNKVEVIYNAMGWDFTIFSTSQQLSIFKDA